MRCRQNLRAVKEGRVAIVDGNQMFARPGPRLVDALEFLVGLLHKSPALIPADFPWTWWDTQKAAALAETKAESLSVHTKGRTGSTNADSSSQAANGSSSNTADGSMLMPNGSSTSSSACKDIVSNGASVLDSNNSTSQSGGGNQAAEQSAWNSQGCTDKAGQQSAEQSGTASQNGPHAESAQQAAGQSGSAPQDNGSSIAGRQAERKWGAAPFLGPEIEEAHAAAIDAGQPTYTDPATGYKVALDCIIAHNG